MNNDILFVEGTNDVKDITKKLIKSAADLKSVKTIFVTDNESKYLGQIALKTLVESPFNCPRYSQKRTSTQCI